MVAHHGQQDGRQGGGEQRLQIVGQPRQRQRRRVLVLIRQDLRDDGLEGGREGGGGGLQAEDQQIDLPGFRDERQGQRHGRAHRIGADQHRGPGQPVHQGGHHRRDRHECDDADRQGGAHDDSGLVPRDIDGQQAEGHRQQSRPDQGQYLRGEQPGIGAVAQRGQHHDLPWCAGCSSTACSAWNRASATNWRACSLVRL